MVTKSFSSLSIYMVGDVFIASSDNPGLAFKEVAGLLQEADVTLANAEGVICSKDLRATEEAPRDPLRWPPESVYGLKESGIDAISIANNHSGDFGDEGVLQEIGILDKVGIPHAGGGRNIDEAHRPCIIERKGYKIGLLAYTSCYTPVSHPATESKPGVAVIEVNTAYEVPWNIRLQPGLPARVMTYPNPRDKELMLSDVIKLKENVDFIVVGFHWGVTRRGKVRSLRIPIELVSAAYILDYQEELAKAAIDAGADFIWGHHPHELQGIEVYKGKLICYSLGNFVWDMRGRAALSQSGPRTIGTSVKTSGGEGHTSRNYDSMIVKCVLTTTGQWRYSYIPVRLEAVMETKGLRQKANILSIKEGAYILSDIIKVHSQKYGTKFIEEGNEVVIQ